MRAELGKDTQGSSFAQRVEVLPREQTSKTLMWEPPPLSPLTFEQAPRSAREGGRGTVCISLWLRASPWTLPSTAGSHLYKALPAGLAEFLHVTEAGLAIIQNPRVQVQEGCSFSGRPCGLSLGSQPRSHRGHQTRCWDHCPETSLGQEGTSPRQPPPLDRSRPAATMKGPTSPRDLPPTTRHPPEGINKWTLQ